MAADGSPPEFQAMMRRLMDYSEEHLPAMPQKFSLQCRVALSRISQAEQYHELGAEFRRQAFFYYYQYIR
jgi:hypothetical protein